MSRVPFNDTYEKQQKRLVRATFKKGFINAVHVAARSVDVYFSENTQTVIRNIPVSTQIDMTTVIVGARCRIDVFDETNPSDMAMAYTY